MQLLWLNLVTDIFPGLGLALEQPEPDVLRQPPRPPEEPILKQSDFKRITAESVTLSASVLGSYIYGILRYGIGLQASTIAFMSMVAAQLIHALSCRSEKHRVWSKTKLPPNRYLGAALGGSFALQLLCFIIPGLRGLLKLAPINALDSVVIGSSAFLPFVVNEATKKEQQQENRATIKQESPEEREDRVSVESVGRTGSVGGLPDKKETKKAKKTKKTKKQKKKKDRGD
jgi:Ca2+-transporting ATPase